jgi:Flp pilus assembly protein TadG
MISRIPVLRRRNGNVFVEFALSATLLVFLFLGTFQFGYTFYLYNALTNAVRSGARYASMAKISNNGNGAVPANYQTAIRNVVVYGSPTVPVNAIPVVPGLSPSDVGVIVTWDSKFVPQTVTVRVNSFQIDALVRKFSINNKPSLQFPYMGQYCPIGC